MTIDGALLDQNKSASKAEQTAMLHRQLWSVADVLRGQMDASEYQRYMLGVIFYKYLSELQEQEIREYYDEPTRSLKEIFDKYDGEGDDSIEEVVSEDLNYFIQYEHMYQVLIEEINKGEFGRWSTELLKEAFNNLSYYEDANGHKNFEGLFDDIDLNTTRLGMNPRDRNNKMAEVFTKIDKIDFKLEESEIDVLGDAYEYLISNFASEAGKKGGEFYTPQEVSEILARIVSYETPDLESVYDPTCGSGSLLLRAFKRSNAREDDRDIHVFGQELNTSTYNLARMNMFIHGRKTDQFTLVNENTLTNDLLADQTFDAIVANPPYSIKWKHTTTVEQDERYTGAGALAPQSKADFAFVQHAWHHLNDGGTAAIVLPHGVLFRGGAENKIRQWLIKQNALHAIIGLPEDLFFGTSIATVILVLKKGREEQDTLFIDASQNFAKGKNQNFLKESHIVTIMDTYKAREQVDKFAELVSRKQLRKNDYNLNIPRYVDITEDEVIIDLEEVEQNIAKTLHELEAIDSEIDQMIAQLHPVDHIPVIRMEEDEDEDDEEDDEPKTLL